MAQKPHIVIDKINHWLSNKYDGAVTELAPIAGGFWSAAYGYRVGEEQFVLRFNDMAEGFALDAARALGSPVDISEQVAAFYDEIAAAGHTRWDTSSLISRLS